MKAAAFDYTAATSLAEAISLLAANPGETKAIAGGQSLGPMLNLRLARPKHLVDLGRVGELRQVENGRDQIVVGAGVTHSEIEDGRFGVMHPALRQVAAGIAYRTVRNRGTIGGSLAHADPAADWPLALAALGAQVRIAGPHGARSVAADSFMTAAFTTLLADDELIESVTVPALSADARWGYYKFCRKIGEFPEASAVVAIDPERRWCKVLIGALDGAPRSLPEVAEQCARGDHASITSESIKAAIGAVAPQKDPVDRHIHAAAVSRALQAALQ